jgi:hypothetical protein
MISVILPTVRPHLFERCLASLAAKDVAVEVVVVADFPRPPEVSLDSQNIVVWVERPRAGTVDAVNAGASIVRGDWRLVLSDEARLDVGCLDALWHEGLKDRMRLLTPRHLPPFDFAYYGRQFAPFPYAHRDLIMRLGGLFDPAFRSFYADPDLGMRAHAAGFPVVTVEAAVVHHHQEHDLTHVESVAKWFDADRAAFRERWDHLGRFQDP